MTEKELEYLKSVLRYDENSKTGLSWNVNYFVGNPRVILRASIGQDAGSLNQNGYYRVKYKNLYFGTNHRLIWMFHNGLITPDKIIDHLDGNKLNNVISNLRLCSSASNARNATKYKRNTSGVTGVSLHAGRYWKAQWYDLSGKLCCKYFSINKLGNEAAFALACGYRGNVIKELNIDGAGYTERHGK